MMKAFAWGGAALVVVLSTACLFATEASAQEPVTRTSSPFAELGAGAWIIAGLGVAAIVCAILGARRGTRWPHWPGLVGGLGEAAFLFAVITGLSRLHAGLATIAEMGAAVTFSRVAGGVAPALAALVLGAWVALLALGLRGLLRLRYGVGPSRQFSTT